MCAGPGVPDRAMMMPQCDGYDGTGSEDYQLQMNKDTYYVLGTQEKYMIATFWTVQLRWQKLLIHQLGKMENETKTFFFKKLEAEGTGRVVKARGERFPKSHPGI